MKDKEKEMQKRYKVELEKSDRAFPIYCNLDDSVNLGISKREYFAAMALASQYVLNAAQAVAMADSILEELNKD